MYPNLKRLPLTSYRLCLTASPQLMRPWIVTQIVLGVLNVIGGVVDTIYHMAYVLGAAYLFFGVTETVFGFLGFLYFGGMVVVHYNLMLAAQENAPTVLADITKVGPMLKSKLKHLEFSLI